MQHLAFTALFNLIFWKKSINNFINLKLSQKNIFKFV